MTQRHPRKLSSRAEALREKLAATRDFDEIKRLQLLHMDELFELSEFEWRGRQSELLREIANLQENGIFRFLRASGAFFPKEPEANYIALRNQLRDVWTHSSQSAVFLNAWLMWHPSQGATQRELIEFYSYSHPPFICSLRDKRLIPNFGSLRAALIQAVLEKYEYLRICQNPNCPAPYFVANRKDQKMCDNADCKAEAQRQFALDYWNREGHKKRLSVKRKKSQNAPQKLRKNKNSVKE